jgi:N-acetylglucosamine kinase-like BadF-type ATPase
VVAGVRHVTGSQAVLGVDAGGTKIDALVVDRDGAVLAFVRGGGANHEAIGWARAQEQLRSTVVEALEVAEVAPESIAASGWGLAGLDWPSDEIRYRGIIADLGFPNPALIANDAFLALAARPDVGSGVGIVSGTGVVVVGRAANGTTTRTLGVGAGRGDWGSGGDIARAAAKAIAAQHMGLGPETALTELALQRSGLASVDAYCQQVWRQRRTSLLPPDVWQVAAAGDAVAAGIADRVADSLAAGAGAVTRRLDLQRPDVILTGRVLDPGHPLLHDRLVAELAVVVPGCRPRRLGVPPVVGAIGAAARSLGWNTSGLQDLGRELVPRAGDTPRRSERVEPTSAASPDT